MKWHFLSLVSHNVCCLRLICKDDESPCNCPAMCKLLLLPYACNLVSVQLQAGNNVVDRSILVTKEDCKHPLMAEEKFKKLNLRQYHEEYVINKIPSEIQDTCGQKSPKLAHKIKSFSMDLLGNAKENRYH